MPEFNVDVTADLKQLKSELGKIPGIGAKNARKLVADLNKNLKGAERAAKSLAKANQDSGKRVKAGFEAAKQAAEGLGGAVGGAAGQVEKFARSATEAGVALGPVGGAVGVASLAVLGWGVAIVGTTAALVSMIRSAEDWAEAIEDIEGLSPVPDDAVANIEDFNDALDGAGHQLRAVGVAMAGDFAAPLQSINETMLKATLIAGDLWARLGDGKAVLAGLANVIGVSDVAQAALGVGLDALSDATGDYDARVQEIIESTREKKDADDNAKKSTDAAREATKAAAEAERERSAAIKEQIALFNEKQRATATLVGITRSAASDEVTAEQAVEDAYEDRIDKIAELALARGDAGAASEAVAAADARRMRDLTAIHADERRKQEERDAAFVLSTQSMMEALEQANRDYLMSVASSADSVAGTIAEFNAAISNGIAQQTRKAQEAHDTRMDLEERAAAFGLEAVEGRTQAERDAAADEQELLLAKADGAAWLEKKHQEAAMRQWKVSRGLALTQIAFSAAAAVIKAFADWGWPAGIVPAAASAALGVSQAAVVLSQPPPFVAGGMVRDRALGNHAVISASDDEGIATGRGVDLLGGPAGLASLNAGQAPMGSVVIQLDGATLAAAVLSPGVSGAIVARLAPEVAARIQRATIYGRG